MPRRLFLLVLVAVGLPGLTRLQAADDNASDEQARQEVIKVSNAIDKALSKDNADELAPFLCEDLEYTQQTGVLLSKAEWLARVRSKKIINVALVHQVADVHVYGDAAVLTGISHSKVIFAGKLSTDSRRFTRTFVKQDGVWRLAAQHVSIIANP